MVSLVKSLKRLVRGLCPECFVELGHESSVLASPFGLL